MSGSSKDWVVVPPPMFSGDRAHDHVVRSQRLKGCLCNPEMKISDDPPVWDVTHQPGCPGNGHTTYRWQYYARFN
jgi:hypothetical protein